MRNDHHDDFDGTCQAPGCTSEIPQPEGRPRRRTYSGEKSPGTDARTNRDQRRTCSAKCRTALSRSRREKPRSLATCRLCGQPFLQRGRGRRTTCPYDDADSFCQELQDDAEDAESRLKATRVEAICQGPDCEEPVPYSGRGRPSKFHSAACRTRSYRSTQKGA
ncbi:hypothetical protein HUT19_15210 [Streptomyces sp. NA02950]|uniref:hypothetical protein n=1 Tax=Streptomyces sp. NA02950 TaxID=2742137 RepID=UPI001592934B|nr:hypothetical protein [Streptomyces sp. NA02950]QKV92938.1 hypothetical protein HUT19_15210 [Streptomyces sp. NA02950]